MKILFVLLWGSCFAQSSDRFEQPSLSSRLFDLARNQSDWGRTEDLLRGSLSTSAECAEFFEEQKGIFRKAREQVIYYHKKCNSGATMIGGFCCSTSLYAYKNTFHEAAANHTLSYIYIGSATLIQFIAGYAYCKTDKALREHQEAWSICELSFHQAHQRAREAWEEHHHIRPAINAYYGSLYRSLENLIGLQYPCTATLEYYQKLLQKQRWVCITKCNTIHALRV